MATLFNGRRNGPNYEVLVLKRDFQRATQVMSQVCSIGSSSKRWIRDWEGSATDYWAVRATDNGWLPKNISELVWSGQISTLCAPLAGGCRSMKSLNVSRQGN